MSTLVISQNDKKIRGSLIPYRMPGWTRFLDDHKLRYKFDLNIELLRSPSGEKVFGVYISSAAQIVRMIIAFADGQLSAQQDDLVTIRIVSMFHQTSNGTVKKILRALSQLPRNREWRRLPFKHNKHLKIDPVVLLSCESATDRSFQTGPNPPSRRELAKRRYSTQASVMRTKAGQAFVTPMAPPPTDPQGWYDPSIITFTTGNVDTGGIELNPFVCRFRSLPGAFRDNGSWTYDPTPAGQGDEQFRQGTPTGGTVHVDHVNQDSSSTQTIPSGQPFQIIP